MVSIHTTAKHSNMHTPPPPTNTHGTGHNKIDLWTVLNVVWAINKLYFVCSRSASRTHSNHHLWLLADDLGPQAGCDCHAHSSSREWQSEHVVLARRHGPVSSIVLMYTLYVCSGVWWWGVQFHCVHLKMKHLSAVSYLYPIKRIT